MENARNLAEDGNFFKKAVPGAYPIKILQRKLYAMLIFKHPDWLIHLSSQSEYLKISIA